MKANTLCVVGHDTEQELLTIRPLDESSFDLLFRLKDELSKRSRTLFCPYDWDNTAQLTSDLNTAIHNSLSGLDASFIIQTPEGRVAGHCFLWKAGGNPLSQQYGVEVPELGIAITDAYQGKGVGTHAIAFLKNLARETNRDAIELTTALDNDGGWHLYSNQGFVDRGLIQNPLRVDVTEAAIGNIHPQEFRTERQMAYLINTMEHESVERYLASKRARFPK